MREFDPRQLQKLDTYRERGINPYPSGSYWPDVNYICDALEHRHRDDADLANYSFIINARVMFKNHLGKIGFARVRDESEQIQIVVRRNLVSEEDFYVWKKLDVGDLISCYGSLCRTQTGEFSLEVQELTLISKCISAMPDKVTGLVDPELRQRQRYLDLIVNDDSRRVFQARSQIIRILREALESMDFMEVETPTLQSIPGGASARPFVTHHNTLEQDMFLRIAPELYLKRLLVGGFNRVYEIGKNFRNEGFSPKHNPEFTMIEFYWAYANYSQLMDFTEQVFGRIAAYMDAYFPEWNVHYIDIYNFRRLRFSEAISEYTGITNAWDMNELRSYVDSCDSIELPDNATLGEYWVEIFDYAVEPNLIDPTFITHFPTEISPLARQCDNDPRLTDRFELFINGQEMANGFNELNDPVEQARRFKAQAELKSNGDDEAMFFDEDYINALSYGMPPAAGEGIGIDRLVMLFTGCDSIRDVILFPTLRRV